MMRGIQIRHIATKKNFFVPKPDLTLFPFSPQMKKMETDFGKCGEILFSSSLTLLLCKVILCSVSYLVYLGKH